MLTGVFDVEGVVMLEVTREIEVSGSPDTVWAVIGDLSEYGSSECSRRRSWGSDSPPASGRKT